MISRINYATENSWNQALCTESLVFRYEPERGISWSKFSTLVAKHLSRIREGFTLRKGLRFHPVSAPGLGTAWDLKQRYNCYCFFAKPSSALRRLSVFHLPSPPPTLKTSQNNLFSSQPSSSPSPQNEKTFTTQEKSNATYTERQQNSLAPGLRAHCWRELR